MGIRLQYVSDLHLEFYTIRKEAELQPERWIVPDPAADALVLAGDIGWPDKASYSLFLCWCSANWPRVFVLAGNHEFYGGESIAETFDGIQRICRALPNVTLLNRTSAELVPGVRILGTTLWSFIPNDMVKVAQEGLNDFRLIRPTGRKGPRLTVEDYKTMHLQDIIWISGELAAARDKGEKAVVVTHHMPSFKLIHPRYADSPVNFCFATDCDAFIEVTQPLAWICGHSHLGSTITIGETQLVLNPCGYPDERVSTRQRTAVLEIALPAANPQV